MRRDYHGSGTYELDEPAISRTSLTIAWILSGAKRRLRRFLLWAAPPSSSRTLLRDGKRSFSKLGAQESTRRPADCPFPKELPRPGNDWRVLP